MASALVGAVVGTFKVGDGTKVGIVSFQADHPKLTLKGGHFALNIVADLKVITVGRARMTLAGQSVAIPVSSTPSFVGVPRMTVRGGHFNLITPTKMNIAKAGMTLRGRSYTINKSFTISIGHPKMTLRGRAITKVGRAGMVPSAPVSILLTPHGAPDTGTLTPTPARAGLLVPTVEDFV